MNKNLEMNRKLLLLILCLNIFGAVLLQAQNQPNVLLIIADDQGYGDLGITGNPHIKTPVIDNFAQKSIRFNQFYVSPVCAPTRSSLMTGRFSLRTGIRDTYNGGAIMAPEEVTIAEMLKKAGYTCGIFGKWHLGDNYPSRPVDQGFDEAVVHLSGGMGQVGDFTTWFQGDSSYFNPVLWHNGEQQKYTGYCTDIYATQAIRFIENHQNQPFFCYLAFNAPHTPLQVPEEYYQMYKDIDPTSGFEKDNRPFPEMNEKDMEDARKVYAMVTNIDDNFKKLFEKLDELNISENTVIIFMTDNGPQQRRYIAGMRGRKGSVYRGGVRVPFFFSYPEIFEGNRDIEKTAAHIDVLPTLAELCGAKIPDDRIIDGKSLVPLMQADKADWPERSLFFYWNRRYPELYNNIALHKGKYKLAGHTNYDAAITDFELFDIKKDPYEQNNIVNENKKLAQALKDELDKTYIELITSENIVHPPLTAVGSEFENPVYLNRNDAGGDRGIWAQEEVYGKWAVDIHEGTYNITFKFIQQVDAGGQLLLETGAVTHQMQNNQNTDVIEMNNVHLPAMKADLIPFYAVNGKQIFPFWVKMEKVN